MDQLHILVVDDNHINRLYLKTILTQWQHHVTEVDSGEGALSTCQQQPFDLILMDIRMQPMDGVTAAARIKQLSQHRETPIIAVSAEQIDCTSHPQFCQCIVKPLHKTALKNLIEQQASRNCQQQPASLFDENMA
ncbi:MAG: response regulator, partial [Proteobacteria bacterium]